MPKIFNVNWFRKGSDGTFLWTGYGDNVRVLKWVFERVEGTAAAVETPIGYVPRKQDIDISGLSGIADKLDECELIAEHQPKFGSKLPKEISSLFCDIEKHTSTNKIGFELDK